MNPGLSQQFRFTKVMLMNLTANQAANQPQLPLLVAVLDDALPSPAAIADGEVLELADLGRMSGLEASLDVRQEVLELADLCCSHRFSTVPLAVSANGWYVWGDAATLQAYVAASRPELLESLSWVLTGSDTDFSRDLAAVEAAGWLESLKQLYIEYPVEQLPDRSPDFPAAVDLRRADGAANGADSGRRSTAEQVATVVWALWHGAELLALDATAAAMTAAQQARQVCCARLAA